MLDGMSNAAVGGARAAADRGRRNAGTNRRPNFKGCQPLYRVKDRQIRCNQKPTTHCHTQSGPVERDKEKERILCSTQKTNVYRVAQANWTQIGAVGTDVTQREYDPTCREWVGQPSPWDWNTR